ncbi:transposase [Planctellipticum variicoloris]|uniref:transposase n=1 Tax=Planctellipticum variicoloris TaxID=3064265 RepID=UPI003013BE76|nr:transposase [Planctomycetaceae bacterium SH412]
MRDPRRLSDRQVAEIYRRRGSIEPFLRDFTQPCGCGKLRSHKAEHAACERIWSLLGLRALLLYARQPQPESDDDPSTSVARVLRAFGRAPPQPDLRPAAGKTLTARLSTALVDRSDRRDKRSRGSPRKQYEPPAKPPQIPTATADQRLQAPTPAPGSTRKGFTTQRGIRIAARLPLTDRQPRITDHFFQNPGSIMLL